MIEILKSGPANTVQDAGRRGLLHQGISRSGAMDMLHYRLGNALLGNPPDAAALEVAMFPFRLRLQVDTVLAITGADARAEVGGRHLPPNWVVPVAAGTEITLAPPTAGARVYLGFAGGIDVPQVLGARATDLKGGFGGHQGRGLQPGDRLPLGPAASRLPATGLGARLPDAAQEFWQAGADRAEIRVIPAAEAQDFSAAARAAFTATDWIVTHEANRMGYHLDGPTLDRTGSELLSHGLLPGTVQVPASGVPIVQLADANTCGGYPKMAVAIPADLWKFAQLGPGATLRFTQTDMDTARAAELAEAKALDRVRAAFQGVTVPSPSP